MLYLAKLDFEEMSQPLKVYSNRADAEREIEIAKEIMVRLWAAWPSASKELDELHTLFPICERERVINGTMHPNATYGQDWLNWAIMEIEEG